MKNNNKGEYSVFDLRNFWRENHRSVKKNIKFTPSEDQELQNAVREYGKNWLEVAKLFPERDPIGLRNRYYILKKSEA